MQISVLALSHFVLFVFLIVSKKIGKKTLIFGFVFTGNSSFMSVITGVCTLAAHFEKNEDAR